MKSFETPIIVKTLWNFSNGEVKFIQDPFIDLYQLPLDDRRYYGMAIKALQIDLSALSHLFKQAQSIGPELVSQIVKECNDMAGKISRECGVVVLFDFNLKGTSFETLLMNN